MVFIFFQFVKDDNKSLQRKIDEQLVFIVRQKYGRRDGYVSKWQLPQLQNEAGESLKEVRKRKFQFCSEYKWSYHPLPLFIAGVKPEYGLLRLLDSPRIR